MADVVIGVGTNLGDRLAHLRRGTRALRRLVPHLRISAISPIYESDALMPDGAPPEWDRPYLNLALRGDWSGDPASLLSRLKFLEAGLGRRPHERWSPREVDFDLLTFGGLWLREPDLAVPHPGLADRPFALLPLADVAPDWRFPEGSGLWSQRTAAIAASPWRVAPEGVPLRTRRTFLSLTEVVGVVNLTPDSFSDGEVLLDPASAADHAERLVAEGATVIDLGAESTRPGATPVSPAEEWRRLSPVLARLRTSRPADAPPIVLSVDTRNPVTARRAVDAGADWINDVTGLGDPAMVSAVAHAAVDVVAMHSLGIPPTQERTVPRDRDPIRELLEWGSATLASLAAARIAAERIILDPGIGFGKTPAQSAEILRRAHALTGLGVRVLVGHSRKSFLADWYPAGMPGREHPVARDLESAHLAAHLAGLGIDYVRVHDVGLAVRTLRAQAFAGPGVKP